jgi:hypothetical protein
VATPLVRWCTGYVGDALVVYCLVWGPLRGRCLQRSLRSRKLDRPANGLVMVPCKDRALTCSAGRCKLLCKLSVIARSGVSHCVLYWVNGRQSNALCYAPQHPICPLLFPMPLVKVAVNTNACVRFVAPAKFTHFEQLLMGAGRGPWAMCTINCFFCAISR